MQRGAERSGWLRLRQLWVDSADRLNPSRGAVVAMASIAALVALLAGLWVLAARPDRLAPASFAQASAVPSPKAGGSLTSPLPMTSSAASAASAAQIVIDVVGKVHRPGVYRLTAGARVADAVTAAGGPTAGTDLTLINLARKLTDGEQVAVGITPAPVPPANQPAVGAPATNGGPSASAPLDLNTASETQLDALPGVGPVLAQHIVEWRATHGRFDSVAQLNSVSGIGDAKFADLRELVTVE